MQYKKKQNYKKESFKLTVKKNFILKVLLI